MSRALVRLNLWLLGGLMVVGIPLLTVALQATIRRLAPDTVKGEHNDVAGFLIAVVGVVYAVTLAFIVIVTWEGYREARTAVLREAGSLRSLYRDSRGLPEPARSQMGTLVVQYGQEVATGGWRALDRGESSPVAFGFITQMFDLLAGVSPTTPAHDMALQIFVILVLSHPFSGDLAVSPDPFLRVVRDFGG